MAASVIDAVVVVVVVRFFGEFVRHAKNKRKLDDTSRNNQNQQQPFKRHNMARAYTDSLEENKVSGDLNPCALNATTITMGSVFPSTPTVRGLAIWPGTVEASLLFVMTNSLDMGIPPRHSIAKKSVSSKLNLARDGAVANMEYRLHLLKPLIKREKDNSSKALDVGLVVTKSNETESKRHVLSSRSKNDTHTDDADINSVNDKQLMAEVHLSAEHNILANEQQHFEQSASVYDTYLLEKVDRNTTPKSTDMSRRGGDIDQNADVKKYPISYTQKPGRKIITGHSFSPNRSSDVREKTNTPRSCLRWIPTGRIFNTVGLKWVPTGKTFTSSITKTVKNAYLKAQIHEKVFVNAALKNKLRKSKGNSVDTKFAKPSILGKPVLQPPKNQSVVRQPNAFKSKRPNFSKPLFASQVDVNNILSKLVTPHYLPKLRESAPAKPHHVNAPSSFRNSQKESYGSNDMARNYYLDEAKKKTQAKNRNLKPKEIPSAKTHHTPNAFTPKPRSNNQTYRN
nr:hypothetical protein [Tanacetum cinerariifolium]